MLNVFFFFFYLFYRFILFYLLIILHIYNYSETLKHSIILKLFLQMPVSKTLKRAVIFG